MKAKQMFKQKMFRQPTGCIPWQPEVLCGKLLNLEVTVGVAVSASKCSQILSAQNDHSHVQTPTVSLPKRLSHGCPPPPQRQCVICLTPHGHLSTNGSETFPGTTSRQLNLFSMMMLNTSLDPKPNAINGPQCKILTDMAMALFFQYQQCNFSRPIRLQFLWKDAREILALKASLRISLVLVWNHLKSTCNVSASNPQRLEQGARLGQLCRYKRERTKITRSSRWSLCCNVCTWKTPGRRSSGSWWSRQPCVSALV